MAGFGTAVFDEGCDAELDMLFVAPDMQRLGIGSRIVSELEERAESTGAAFMCAYVSLTARSFFVNRGFEFVCDNIAVRRGVELPNVFMRKPLGRDASGRASTGVFSSKALLENFFKKELALCGVNG